MDPYDKAVVICLCAASFACSMAGIVLLIVAVRLIAGAPL